MKRQLYKVMIVACLFILFGWQPTRSQTISYYDTGEEFTGPLPGWKDVKKDFGAKGDGVTDDAPAITAALHFFRDIYNIENSVLYFPAGTYRLGSTILNADRSNDGTSYTGLAIVGEDPSTTKLLWDGPADETMFRLDGWYLKVSRLTFDGQKKAKTGLLRDGGFGTGVEYSDLVFNDLIFGTQLGGDSGMGQAENLFLRCRFYNCDVGIYGPNMNSLDTWVWYCLFQDCKYGIHLGGYQAYGNVFLRSKTCDLGLSWQPTCMVNNISVNTRCFNNYFQDAGLFQGNKIYDPDTTLVRGFGNIYDTIKSFTVPYLTVLLDNIFRTYGNSGPAVTLSEGKCISAGNTFTQKWPLRPRYQPYARGTGGFPGPVTNAVDGDPSTVFWGYLNGDTLSGIAWLCPAGTSKTAVRYSITENGMTSWYLKSFRLVGSNDWGNNITVLDSQTDQTWIPGETKTFTFQNSLPYSMYRLEVLSNADGYITGSGFCVAEFSLMDQAGSSLMKEPGGFVAGAEEKWGDYYSLQEKQAPYSSIQFPGIIELPGTPRLVARRIFKVRQGTQDDAAEIQLKIDSAKAMPAGTKPIVFIPKGLYNIKRTIVLPANVEMTLTGEGLYQAGTFLNPDPALTGPTMKIRGPSHLLVRDISIGGNEAIYAEVDDQPGSRVTGNLINFGGWDPNNLAENAMIIDGIEQAYMLFSGYLFWCYHNGVLIKGGPVLSSGGSTSGQIAFLGGASSYGQNMWETQNNGRLIVQGMWYEAEIERTKSLINLTGSSSGSLALGGIHMGFNPVTDRPVVSVDNFQGQLTSIANNFGGSERPQYWQITGNGSGGRILSAVDYWSLGSDSASQVNTWPYWNDKTSPPASASRIFCYGPPDITDKVINTLPDTSSLLSSLSLMRSLRILKPGPALAGDAHIDFIRVNAHNLSGGGTAVRFVSGKNSGNPPESPVLAAPANHSASVSTEPTLSWSVSEGATSYQIQVSESEFFNTIAFESANVVSTTIQTGSLKNNTEYFWRVSASNQYGSSNWSSIWVFNTGTGTSIEPVNNDIPTRTTLGNNFPNPFSESTSVRYSLSAAGKVELTISDSRGKAAETLVNEFQTPGTYEVKIDGSKFPAGVYFYTLQAGKYSGTKKMIVIK